MIYILLIILTLLTPCIAQSDPSVSGVSGSVTDGQSITITGSSFGTKSPAAPLVWDTFENGTTGSSISGATAVVGTWAIDDNTVHPVYSISDKWAGSKSASLSYDLTNYSVALFKDAATTFPILYLDWKVKGVAAQMPRSWKPFRVYGNSGTNYPEWVYNQACWGYQYHMIDNNGGCGTSPWVGAELTLGQWHHLKFAIKESSNGVSDGASRFWQDGTSYYSSDAVNTRCTNYDLTQIRIGHYWGGSSDGNCPTAVPTATVYIDNVYIDTTWARVEICDANTYSGSTHCEIQIPSAWSASSATVTVNAGTLTGTNYLYLVDSSGAANSNGCSVTFGQTMTGCGTTGSLSSPTYSGGSLSGASVR